jgi:hypothetical protein
MKIDGYSVQIGSQYYNLQHHTTQGEIKQQTNAFKKDDSLNPVSLEREQQALDKNNKLSIELSKAILQNISSESRRVIGDRVEINSTSIEAQGLNFLVSAKVIADGKEMNISIDLSLSRSFIQKNRTNISLASLYDPLVISLDGGMPNLSSSKFAFDIDSDGKSDQISLLKNGSGFLALDRNNNGKIDDGGELFGTKSGDGFGDLSKYDDDDNGWIDSNDAIFDKLRIWSKTSNKDELLALGEVGIGAIFLGNTQTPFSLKSESNELLGEMRKSGMVLFENFKAGVISHIDMAVETKDKLTALDVIKKNISILDTTKVYTNNQNYKPIEAEEEDALSKLQKEIRILEAKLSKARGSEKTKIQIQINVLMAQMMTLLGG